MSLDLGQGTPCSSCSRVTADPHYQGGRPLCRGCWLDWRDV